MSYTELLAWRDQKDLFEDVGAYANSGFVLTGAGEPEQLRGMSVSACVLQMFAVRPDAGRVFRPEEDARSASPVAMIAHSFWESHFRSNPNAVGQTLILNDRVFTIV